MWTLPCCFIVRDRSFLKSIFSRWMWSALQPLTASEAPYKAFGWTLHEEDRAKSSFLSYPTDRTTPKHVFPHYLQHDVTNGWTAHQNIIHLDSYWWGLNRFSSPEQWCTMKTTQDFSGWGSVSIHSYTLEWSELQENNIYRLYAHN